LIGPPAIVLELWGMPPIEVPLWTPSCKIETNVHASIYRGVWTLGKTYGNTQVLLANLQHFCNNNNIILNYYYFIPGLFPSHSWWAENCSVRLSRGMVCSWQPRNFQGVHPHRRTDRWTEDGWRDGWRDAQIQGRLHFSSRRPLLYRMPHTSPKSILDLPTKTKLELEFKNSNTNINWYVK
jgi:hypothetical protein